MPAGAFRGMGTPQVVWAYESQMDMIAYEMGWDPVEFRLKNLMEKGDDFCPGDTPVDCNMKEGLRRVAKEIGWGEKQEPDCGIGVSCALKDGGGNYKISEARIEVNANGQVTLFEGTVEIGQGSNTALRKIAATGTRPRARTSRTCLPRHGTYAARFWYLRQQRHDCYGAGSATRRSKC